MNRIFITIAILMLITCAAHAQGSTGQAQSKDITGEWMTQEGNVVDITVSGNDATLDFTLYARKMTATFDGSVLVYTTHYNDPSNRGMLYRLRSRRSKCVKWLIKVGDPRHRFTLTLFARRNGPGGN